MDDVLNAAHFLLVWTYQQGIENDPEPGRQWRISDLHPGTRAMMNNAEQQLYDALVRHEAQS